MNGKHHLAHVDQLRIDRDRSSKKHKAKAIVNAIRNEFFAGTIRYTISEQTDTVHIHVLHNKSHRNAVKGLQTAAKHRFGIDTEIVDQNVYRTVIAIPV
jgi:hypothetical protein